MTPELVSSILSYVDTGAVIIVLIWVVKSLTQGAIISRPMHDEILDVYRGELKEITNGINGSLQELTGEQKKVNASNKRLVKTMKKNEKNLIDGLGRIETAIINGGKQ